MPLTHGTMRVYLGNSKCRGVEVRGSQGPSNWSMHPCTCSHMLSDGLMGLNNKGMQARATGVLLFSATKGATTQQGNYKHTSNRGTHAAALQKSVRRTLSTTSAGFRIVL